MSRQALPGPSTPALVQLVAYARDPYGYFERQHERYGDVFTMDLPGVGKQVVVASPEGVEQLVSAKHTEITRDAEFLRYLLGEHALIFQNGQPHLQMRQLMTPPFHGERMRAYGPDMMRVADEVLAQRDPAQHSPIQRDMQEIALRVILRCVFGVEQGARFDRMRELMLEFLDGMSDPWMFAASMLLPRRGLHALIERMGQRHRVARPGAAEALSRLPLKRTADRLGALDALLFDEIEAAHRCSERREDILSLFVHQKGEQGQLLSRAELRDQLFMLLVAGHETTAHTLCWILWLLARRPDVIAEIRAEQVRVMAEGFDPARARDLPYLGAVIQESMRLMPIALGVARRLDRELVIGGYRLDPGTVAVPCAFLAQRDPRLWDQPTLFDPRRFLGKKVAGAAYFPYGYGVWRCLGASFADYEMRIVLSRLLASYDIELDPQEKGAARLGITVSPLTGLSMRLAPRAVSGSGAQAA